MVMCIEGTLEGAWLIRGGVPGRGWSVERMGLNLNPLTPFLQNPGEHSMPFTTWTRVFENFVLAIQETALADARKRALLIHCLGTEGMPLSAAEKQRQYRQRRDRDPVRREEYLKKEKLQWQKRKETGKVKLVSELSDRAARKLRREWKLRRAKNRKLEKERARTLDKLVTPPGSPTEIIEGVTSSQRSTGERRRRRNKEKILKEMDEMADKLEYQTRQADKYRKRWERLRRKITVESPRAKAMCLLRMASTSAVKKTLIFHNVLVDEIRRKYKSTKQERLKQAYCRLFTGAVAKKYRLRSYMQQQLGFSAKRWPKPQNDQNDSSFHRCRSATVAVLYKKKVEDFYALDYNSRMTTGKKNTVTRKKKKLQKRLLNDTRKNIHSRFLAENPTSSISYSLFCRLKPYWIVTPTEKDRQTCLCKIHENTQLTLSKLKTLKILSTDNMDTIVHSISCNTESQSCMYGECRTCKNLEFVMDDPNEQTTWLQWKTIKETRVIKEASKSVTTTVKTTISGPVSDLIDQCTSQLQQFKRHYLNINHQYKFYRECARS
uniref:uncharacterized protein isoform X2 n=1 Tax=Myxine glutinosa TaxID=7769 RepID=UPI003590066A